MTTTDPVPNLRRCCEARGLLYPDGRRRCWRHATDDDRTLLFDLDKRAAARGIKIDRGSLFMSPNNRRWPYGPNVDVSARIRMLDWAESNDLRLSAGRCMHWLRKGRCADRTCYGRVGGWMDHVTGWACYGRRQPRVLVSQPYNVSAQSAAELAALTTEPGLTVEIHPNSWYGHGTTFVGVWWTDTEAMELHER
ncbi:MAG TPA: hypothetical protein VIS06_12695 [Mycobacteriales bacterium]|jgi:hypothetical protein